jgi:NAD(P)-dependent dehydrogenase (short-subunit alcohol dehydrogenase family)
LKDIMSTEAYNIVVPSLKDRVVIITGAGQGIGRVFAKAFAKAGSRVVIAELNEIRATTVSEVIMEAGAVHLGRPNYLHYIATKAALAGMTLSMARELGPDDFTVNAILPGATFTEIERKTVTPEQKERIIAM